MTIRCPGIHTVIAAFLIGTMAGCQEPSAGSKEANPAVESFIQGKSLLTVVPGPDMPRAEQTRLVDQIRRFYAEVNYQPVWITGDRPSSRYREFAKALDTAATHGLQADRYRVALQHESDEEARISPERVPELEAKVTMAFFRYFSHLSAGRLDPRAFQSMWTLRPEKPDLVKALVAAVQKKDLAGTVARLSPPQEEYRELQQALVRYLAIAASGGWPDIPPNTRLKPGVQSPVVPVLRKRLAVEGDLDRSHEQNASAIFDAAVVDALKRFEERHRLKPDGILDAEAVKALNITVNEKIRTLELNMERWRWLPDTMPSRYLVVNVPDFRLEAHENGQAVMDMRVVVGAPDNKTPIFADEMTHVVFSPYWNVPPGIADEETIPRAVVDPGFIARNNMEIVGPGGEIIDADSVDWSNAKGLRIRQRPGSGNALGGVKFIFPNNFDVYLHDTNATALFDRIERGLSHGCVRVEEPHKLAQYVLRDIPEWTPEAIGEAMKSGEEKHVKLKASIPVFILYKTAWVHQGGVRFLKDLYGHDADQASKLWPRGSTSDGPLHTRR
jgi:L,D-transpeptidase YcbB